MGGGGSKVGSSKAQKLEELLLKELEEEQNAVKILLLGAGESGKSTILKQMKILHLQGFTDEEAKEFKKLVYRNTLHSMQSLCQACLDLHIPVHQDIDSKVKAILAMSADADCKSIRSIEKEISTLWKANAIQQAVKRQNEFHLIDSAPYFLDAMDRTFVDGYTPTVQDILRTRLTTTGIIETDFVVENIRFKMYDVGGQRSERSKWIHCFEDATAVMFVASLSEYDQVLAEDRSKLRLVESLELFQSIINLPWFSKAHVILFLNKKDLYAEKIKVTDPGIFFPSYTGGCDHDAAAKWIEREYRKRILEKHKNIYVHKTDATNTENIEFVWKATKQMLTTNLLTQGPLRML